MNNSDYSKTPVQLFSGSKFFTKNNFETYRQPSLF
jgi:hypothetical protein